MDDDALRARRRLARKWLGQPGGRQSLSHLARALYSPPQRLERARVLLADALALEQKGAFELADESWAWVEREWRWVSEVPDVSRWLMEPGADTAEQVVAQVRAGITSELLPLLHLRAFVLGVASRGKAAPCHWTFLSQWKWGEAPPAPGVVALYALLPLALVEARLEPSEVMLANFHTLLARGVIQGPAVEVFVEDLARMGNEIIEWGLQRDAGSFPVQHWIQWFGSVEPLCPSSLRLCSLLSMLHMLSGVRSARSLDGLARSHEELGRAVLWDPFNRTASEQLEQLHSLMAGLKENHANDFDFQGRNVGRMLHEAEKSLREFERSEEASRLRERHVLAVRRELTRRLGWDASKLEDCELALDVARVFTGNVKAGLEGMEQGTPPSAEVLRHAREATIRFSPRAVELPWEHLDAALCKFPEVPSELLGLMLPISEEVALKVRVAPLLESSREEGAASVRAPGGPGPRATLVSTWLFSGRDMAMKLGAVLGFVLLLQGVVSTQLHSARRARLDQHYQALLTHVSAGDDRGVLSQATDFLEHMSPDVPEPRVRQVVHFYSEALVRDVLRTLQSGGQREAGALLDRHELLVAKFPSLFGEPVTTAQEVHP